VGTVAEWTLLDLLVEQESRLNEKSLGAPPAAHAVKLVGGAHKRALEACADVDPEVMFPEDENGNEPPNDHPDVLAAKAICLSCQVRVECLDNALRKRIPNGVWGAMTFKEREALRRRTSRATHSMRRQLGVSA
jgi:WhiB family redox-sensing transcriptional regulator